MDKQEMVDLVSAAAKAAGAELVECEEPKARVRSHTLTRRGVSAYLWIDSDGFDLRSGERDVAQVRLAGSGEREIEVAATALGIFLTEAGEYAPSSRDAVMIRARTSLHRTITQRPGSVMREFVSVGDDTVTMWTASDGGQECTAVTWRVHDLDGESTIDDVSVFAMIHTPRILDGLVDALIN